MLITGACGGGKTAMFQTLRSGEVFLDRTVTSMDVNEARIEVRSEKLGKSKRARLVDLPGHPRLRAKLDRYANGAKAIIFVVDAVDFTSQRRAVAEHLFEILSHPVVQKRRCPIMIACNKSEKITAHPADFVRKRLEKEIEALRTTRGTLEDTGGGESVTGSVGLDGAEFAFEHQRSNKVEAAGCAVAGTTWSRCASSSSGADESRESRLGRNIFSSVMLNSLPSAAAGRPPALRRRLCFTALKSSAFSSLKGSP